MASRATEIFERSKIDEKRQLITFVFSNLRLQGKKLDFSLRSPFDLMVNRASYTSWLGLLGYSSNRAISTSSRTRAIFETALKGCLTSALRRIKSVQINGCIGALELDLR